MISRLFRPRYASPLSHRAGSSLFPSVLSRRGLCAKTGVKETRNVAASSKPPSNPRDKFLISWKQVFVLAVAGVSFFAFYDYSQTQQKKAARRRRNQKITDTQPQLKDIIGGAWRLTDMFGEKVTEEDFFGQYVIIYFGFTFCPEICPKELGKLTEAMNKLDNRSDKIGQQITPLFFSVDPKRDSPAQLRKYCQSNRFHKRLVGLTGTPEQIQRTAQTFKVSYQSSVEEDGEDDYNVDHSTYMFFMNRSGVFQGILHSSDDADTCAEKMAQWIEEDKQATGP